MKATEQYFPVVLFVMLYKVVLTFKSVDKILWCDHSNQTSLVVLAHGATCFQHFTISTFGKSQGAVNLLSMIFKEGRAASSPSDGPTNKSRLCLCSWKTFTSSVFVCICKKILWSNCLKKHYGSYNLMVTPMKMLLKNWTDFHPFKDFAIGLTCLAVT